jgi:TPR repeat protein
VEIVYRLLSSDRQLSAAIRHWKRGDFKSAVRIAGWAARHNALAKLILAQWLLFPGVAREVSSPKEGVLLLREAIESNVLEAYQVLAGCYLTGDGVEVDRNMAVQLLEESGRRGLPAGWQELVHLFTNGRYFAPDYRRALGYANALACAGYPQMRDTLRAETLGD